MRFRRWCLGVLLLAALVGCQTLDSHAASKVYNFSGFTGVRASAAVDVELTQGEAFRVVVASEDGDFSGLELEVKDGLLIAMRPEKLWKNKTLSIRRVDGRRVVEIDGKSVPTYTVRVTAPRIDHLGASVSSIVMADRIETRKLDIEASSSGDIRAKIAGGDVSVGASSSGDVHVSGTCDKLDIDANSSADVRADDLTCQQGVLKASSSGDIRAKIAGGDVSVDASSGGDVHVSGTCGKLDIEANSSADVKADKLTCRRGDLQASSGADIVVRLTDAVTAHANSGGNIVVRGGATPIKVKETSGGDVSIRD